MEDESRFAEDTASAAEEKESVIIEPDMYADEEELTKARKSKRTSVTETLDIEIGRLKKELDDQKNFSMRLQADFENYKKRNKTVATDMYNEGIYDTVLAVLPVLDNLDRAMDFASEAEKKGVELIHKQFKDALKKLAVEEIEACGTDFDPKLHNAVMQVEDKENAGKVVQVLQKGYKIGDKIIRYCMVQVGV